MYKPYKLAIDSIRNNFAVRDQNHKVWSGKQ